ncbi:MFS transporter [Streptosporangium sp. NPDC049376]|uniref:MFS transporter n=1 Tax=Streptosporangium sp. NPDC049376 TaxID=3366192 RepID=UPI0037B5A381
MKNRRALGLLTVTHGVNDMYQGAVPALLPFLVAERGYSYALATGIIVAATGLSSVVQPLFGVAVDRRRMSWLVAVGMIAAGVGVGLSGLVDDYAWTWLAIAVSGLGVAAYHPAAAKAARIAGGGSARSMGVFSVGGNVGGALAPLFVALVLNAAGTRGTWLLAVPAVVAGVGYLLARRASGSGPATATTPAGAEGATGRDDWRAFARLSALAVFWSIPYVVMGSFAALNVIGRFHVSTATGTATLTVFTAGGVVGTLAGGWLAERRGRLSTIRLGYLTAALAVAGVVFSPGLAGVLCCTALFGTALFVPFAAQVTLAQDYLPNRVGTASGLTLGLTLSVGGLLSPAFGALADAWGVRTVLVCLVAVLAVAVLIALRLPEPSGPLPSPRSDPEPADAAA